MLEVRLGCLHDRVIRSDREDGPGNGRVKKYEMVCLSSYLISKDLMRESLIERMIHRM